MTIATWTTQAIWEGTSLKVMARIVDKNNANITQAGIASIQYRSVADGTAETIALTALTVADVVFDTLQTTDNAWTKDTSGYNFMHIFGPLTFPDGGVTYYLPIEFTDTSSPTAVVSVLGIQVTSRETYLDTPAP